MNLEGSGESKGHTERQGGLASCSIYSRRACEFLSSSFPRSATLNVSPERWSCQNRIDQEGTRPGIQTTSCKAFCELL